MQCRRRDDGSSNYEEKKYQQPTTRNIRTIKGYPLFGSHPLLCVGASSCPVGCHLPPTDLPMLNGADLLLHVPAFSIGQRMLWMTGT